MPTTDPGTSPDHPLYFRILRDDQDQLQWSKIVIALGLTVLSAYLAAQAQRGASSPDQLRSAKMAFYRTVWKVANGQVVFWRKVAQDADTRYDIARL
jgi:hypothetical protein